MKKKFITSDNDNYDDYEELTTTISGDNQDGDSYQQAPVIESDSEGDSASDEKQTRYFIWRSSSGACNDCLSLNGEIFEEGSEPDAPHPNCDCTLEQTTKKGEPIPDSKPKQPNPYSPNNTKPPKDILKDRGINYDDKVKEEGKKREGEKEKEKEKEKKDKWKKLTPQQKENLKQKELEKFKNSDKFKENIKEAEKISGMARDDVYTWMRKNFPTNAKYDLKEGGKKPEMEHVGNFNYGAMGKAAGLSDLELKGAAGIQQIKDGTWKAEFWSSYFDDPVDQKYIQEGIDWYNNYSKNNESK